MVVSTRSKDTLNRAFVFDDKENENKENMKDKEQHKQDEEEKEKKQEKKKIKEKTKEKTRKAAKDQHELGHEVRHRSSHLQDNTNKLKIHETTSTRNRPVKKQIKTRKRNIVIAVIYLIAVIVVCLLSSIFLRSTADDDTGATLRKYTGLNLGELKSTFPTQTPYLWRLIGSASIDFFKHDDPKRPSVILLAAGPDAHSTLDALASDLSTSYTSGDLVTKIDGSEYNMSDADIAKYEIDKTLDSGFNSGKKVAVIHHLESIPAKASMIFHSYCETDNAPFKKVVIIFTVHVTDELNPKDNLKTNEKIVEKHLIQKWKDSVDKDHIDAMFSRVATAVAFVTP